MRYQYISNGLVYDITAYRVRPFPRINSHCCYCEVCYEANTHHSYVSEYTMHTTTGLEYHHFLGLCKVHLLTEGNFEDIS